ncbi:MAG: PAS domain-containing protein [Ktedonobacteraceae bacterium]|nr:PAS domain-containing protein [Ktedonobacteraceae bacterium]
MEPGLAGALEYILGSVPAGVAILDSTSLSILYATPYLLAYLDERWSSQGIIGRHIEEVLPADIYQSLLSLLRQVAASGKRIRLSEVPFEGFLETRGRTYWNITIERAPRPVLSEHTGKTEQDERREPSRPVIITVEDVTEAVRSRLHLNAIQHISSAIASASALPLVLDRILQALYDMVGSRRCAVLLVDQSPPSEPLAGAELHMPGRSYARIASTAEQKQRTITIAAQKNVHPVSHRWHPLVNEHILPGRVEREQRTLIITDTSTVPDIDLPYLIDYQDRPIRPGSVLCVPIFDPYPEKQAPTREILGTIEVYHIRARGFPDEEVRLLERFAQQAGLAIQNARLFRDIERWAHVASRTAHQKENIMQAIPDGVVIYDPRWRVVDANQAARELFEWPEEIIGLPIGEAMVRSHAGGPLLDFLCAPDSTDELERRALTGQIDQFKLIDARGQSLTVRCTYTPIRDSLGDIFAFLMIYHDITAEAAARERIEAEVIARTAELAQRNRALQLATADLELSRARLQLLLERLPSGVMQVDARDSSITLINRHAVQLLQSMGVTLEPRDDPDEAARLTVGMNCEPLFRQVTMYGTEGNVVPFEERPFYRALSRGEASEAELHTVGADEQMLHFLFNAAPLRAPDGSVASVILVLHEITTFKALERAREDFFTTMAHELKTPLANIRAHLSALLARDLQWSPEEQMDFLRTADEQVERLVSMINHFLDASRVEAGALRLQLEPLLLPELVEDLQDRLEALINSSSRHLQISVPADLPAVEGDYELIISVLTNLLSNAFNHTPEGETVCLQVEPLFSPPRKRPVGVTVRVIDRGPGITPEQQQSLFTRFSTFAARRRPTADRPGQPVAAKGQESGRWSAASGLGLYISRGIIEAHGSKLIVESTPGQGTTFSFTLPTFGKGHP